MTTQNQNISIVDSLMEEANKLPAISSAVMDLIRMIDDPNTPREQIIDVTSRDPVLVAHILKLANSAALGFKGDKIDNIDQALNRIGLTALKNLAFMLSARKIFLDRKLWFDSLYTGVASVAFGKQLGKSKQFLDTAYMAGLLHNFGLLVFKRFHPGLYNKVESSRRNKLELEEKTFGINHVDLTVRVMQQWHLPESLTKVLSNQGKFEKGNNPNYTDINAMFDFINQIKEYESIDEEYLQDVIKEQRFGINELKTNMATLKKLTMMTEAYMSFLSS